MILFFIIEKDITLTMEIKKGFFQIKLKIQNEKLNPFPDTFSLDWENLSETELKRLVVQLEKTR